MLMEGLLTLGTLGTPSPSIRTKCAAAHSGQPLPLPFNGAAGLHLEGTSPGQHKGHQ